MPVPLSNIQKIQGTSGGAVGPSPLGTITFSGTNVTIAGNPATNTLTFTSAGGGGGTFIEDNATTASFIGGNLYLLGSLSQGLVTAGDGANTIVFSMMDWTTTQKGVGILATAADATAGLSTTKVVTPQGLSTKLGAQTAYALPVSAGSTQALDWVGPLTYGQLLIGTGTTPHAATLTAGSGIAISNGPGAITISVTSPSNAIYVEDDATTATLINGNLYLLGSLPQGLITSGNRANTIVFSMMDWTTTQKGVGVLATTADATAGLSATKAVTPQGLSTKLGTQTAYALPVSAGSTQALNWVGPLTYGQLLIGTGTTPHAATLTAGTGISITNAPGAITINSTLSGTFVEDDATTAIIIDGNLYLLGSLPQGLITSGNRANTIVFSMMDWTTTQKGVGVLATTADATAGLSATKAVTPQGLSTKLGTQTAYALPVSAGSTQALNWVGPLTYGQLLIGTGTTPHAATLTAGTGISITNAPGAITINSTLSGTFVEDDATTAIIIDGNLYLLGSLPQGLITSGNGINTIVFSMMDWTTTQKGVGVLATTADATAGLSATKAVTPQGLSTKLGTQTAYALPVSAGSTQALNWVGPLTYGQLLIGTGTTPHAATLTAGTGISITNAPGAITINSTLSGTFVEDDATTAIIIDGNIYLLGSLPQGLITSGNGINTIVFSMMDWTTTQKGVGVLATTADATAGLSATKAVTPQGLSTKLGTQTAYALPVSAGSTQALNWVGLLTYGLLLIGTGTTPHAATLTAGTGISISNAPGAITINSTLISSGTFVEDDATTAAFLDGNLYLLGSLPQGLITSGNRANTIVFSMMDWTTTQKGVGVLATTADATAGLSATKAVTPQGLSTKLGTQTAYALPVSVGSTQALNWVGPLTYGQLLIGTGTTPHAATLTAGTGISITNAPGAITINSTLISSGTFVEDDATTAAFLDGNLYLLGSLPQGLITSGNGINTIVFSMMDWTTTQKGVGVLATTADATAGLSSTKVVTPQGLSTKLGTQTAYALLVSAGSTQALNWVGLLTYGLLLIGTGTTPHAATLTAGTGISISNAPGAITINSTLISSGTFVEDDATTAAFLDGNLYLLGSLPQGLITSGNHANTIVFSIMDWTTTQKGVGVLATTADATAGLSATKAVTPQGLGTKLGTQTAYALPVSAGSTQALNWVGPLTYGQLLIGTGTTPHAATLTAGTGISISNAPGAITINSTLISSGTFVEDDATTAAFLDGNLYLLGSLPQGLITSGNGTDTIVFSMMDWTTTQKGVGVLATTVDATAGLSATKAVTPQGLSTKLGTQTAYALPVSAGSTLALNWVGPLTYGQLLIGTGTTPHAATLTAGTGISISNAPGAITINSTLISSGTFVEDDATTAVFIDGNLYLLGSLPQGLITSGNGTDTIVFSMMDWTTTQKGVGVLATTADATAGLSATKAVTPQGLSTKLGTQTAYALPVSVGSTLALNWVGPLTYGQLLIGTGTTPHAATLTAGTGISITNAPGAITINSTLISSGTFVEDDATTAAFLDGNLYLLGSLPQGLITSGNGTDTIVFSMMDWTTTQKGVGVLATTADATAGLSATKAVTPQGLSTKLGTQTAYALPVSAGSTQALNWVGPLTYGQLLIGTGTTPHAATLTAGTGISISNAPGAITINSTLISSGTFVEDDATTAAFLDGNLYLLGSLPQGLITSGNGTDTIVFSMMDWTTTQKGVGVLATTADATAGLSATKVVTPQGLSTKLGTQTAYALPVSAGSTLALDWVGLLTYGLLLIGTGTTPHAATLTAGTGISISNAPGAITINSTLISSGTFVEDDATTAAFLDGNLYLLGSLPQGLITSGNGTDTIVFSMMDWTTTQKGVGVLATTADATAGLSSTKAVTPQGLSTKLGTQTAYALPVSAGSTLALDWVGPLTYGQLLIGTGTTPHAATLTAGTGISISNAPGAITINSTLISSGTFVEDDATTAAFLDGNLYLLGSLPQGLITSGNGTDTIVFSMMDWTTTQKGVGVLATTADATAGLSATKVVTPQGLSTKLGTQTAYALPVSAGSTLALDWVGPLTYGQLLIGTGTTPIAATLTSGIGVTIANAPGSITINAIGELYPVVSSATVTMSSNRNYIVKATNPPDLIKLTLPATPLQGDMIGISGYSSGGWIMAQNANQQIFFGNQATTIGTGGSIASTDAKDSIRILCVTAGASAEWCTVSSIGNLTVT